MRLTACFICLLAFAMLGTGSLRAESSTAEALHKQLKASDDHTLGLLANRWWSLIQRQPWTDSTGKFSVNAKFVSQDAEKKTVTLLASRGKGSDRVEKEITVPLGKLSKQAQARAMRIARLMPKLEEKLAEVEAKEKEEDPTARAEPRLSSRESEFTEAELGAEEFQGEIYGGPPMRARRQPNQKKTLPDGREKDIPPAEEELNEEGQSVSNPYAGTKWIGRDRLVDDRRFEKPVAKPQPKRPEAPVAAPEAAKPDYVIDVEYVPAEFPDSQRDDWEEFYEPLGDESHLEFRTLPVKPIVGKTVRLLVIPSSVYGRPKPKVFIRIGESAADPDSVYKSPDAGPAWAEMELVGGRIQNLDTEKMVLLGETEENPRVEQPGESYYLIGLKLPVGKTALDIKFETQLKSIGTVAFRLMELDVAPGEVGSD